MTFKKYQFLKPLNVLVLCLCITSSGFSQSPEAPVPDRTPARKDLSMERALLFSQLQALEKETLEFNNPLAEALAKAEIAEAAWELDLSWAKKVLRAAYKLVLPTAEQNQGQNSPAGSVPLMLDAAGRARRKIRLRVLEVARRDKDFVNELIELEGENLGAYGKHFASAALADQAIEAGDVNASADYILQGIKADPTQGTAPDIINRVAMRDRTLADRLILQYISELRGFPINSGNQSDVRAFFILSGLIRPRLIIDPSIKIQPPGSEVMRAYISYMLEALNMLEQKEPGYLQRRRRLLLSVWVPLQQYAPELSSAFLSIESRSRKPEEKLSLPTAASIEEEKRSQYERRVKDGMDGDRPHEGVIYAAISRGDFDKARKMINKLPDGARKNHLLETVNAEEAIGLATKGNIYVAEELAKELRHVASIQRVYPVLIAKSAASRDKPRATRLIYQALQQVKTSDTSPPPVPEGIPASAVAYDQRFDPILSFIAKLAADVLPYSADLAFEVLDQLVSAANTTPLDTEQARIGFDVSVFKKLAPKNELHTQQAAYSLRNPVQRVLALSAVYQWKAKELTEKMPKPKS